VHVDPPFSDPGIPDGERTVYRGSISGEEVGTGSLEVEASDDAYVARLETQILDGFNQSIEVRFSRRRGMLRAESYRAESRDGDKRVAVEEGWFRDVRGLHWGAELQKYPSNVTPLLGCAIALRGLDFERGERHRFALWLANTVWWEVEAHVEKRQRVEVPAGSFEAWRVDVAPRFDAIGTALNRVIAAVLPPFRLHFEAAPPHRFLRFSFPTGPFPWNPRGLIEAVELGHGSTEEWAWGSRIIEVGAFCAGIRHLESPPRRTGHPGLLPKCSPFTRRRRLANLHGEPAHDGSAVRAHDHFEAVRARGHGALRVARVPAHGVGAPGAQAAA